MHGSGPHKAVDRSLGVFFRGGVWVTMAHPRQAWQFARAVRWQRGAARTRARWRREGVPVSAIVIFSITQQCNLQCAGCYARSFYHAGEESSSADGAPVYEGALRDLTGNGATPIDKGNGVPDSCPAGELSDARLGGIVAEAADLGVSFFVIAGGEPLLRPEILNIAGRFPRVIFLLFTNGVLIDEGMAARLARLKNVVPLLSLEGTAIETDERRGEGTYEQLMGAMARLKSRRLFFGCSLTLTSRNFSPVVDDEYVGGLVKAGCRLLLFADYTPTDEATTDWVLTNAQRGQVTTRMRSLRKRHPALFVAVPWDEQEAGGCLSSGKGFVHINASGDLEPCPFAPYSDVNLKDMPLREALCSPFLAGLRAMPELSTYTGGGCALWKNREQVQRLLAETRSSGRPTGGD